MLPTEMLDVGISARGSPGRIGAHGPSWGTNRSREADAESGKLRVKGGDGEFGDPDRGLRFHVTESTSYEVLEASLEENKPIGSEAVNFSDEGEVSVWTYSWTWNECGKDSTVNDEWEDWCHLADPIKATDVTPKHSQPRGR